MITKNTVTIARKEFDTEIARVSEIVTTTQNAFERVPDVPIENPDPLAIEEALADKQKLEDEAHKLLGDLIDSYVDIVDASLKRVRFLMRNGPSVYDDKAAYGDDLTEQGMHSSALLKQVNSWKEKFAQSATAEAQEKLEQKIKIRANDLFMTTKWMENRLPELFKSMCTPADEFDEYFSYVPTITQDPKDFFSENTLTLGQAHTRAAQATFDIVDNDLNRFGLIDHKLLPYAVADVDTLFFTRILLRQRLANELHSARAHLTYAKTYLDRADGLAGTMN